MTRPQGFIRNSGIQWQEELFQPFTRSCHIPPSALPYHLSSPGLGVKLLELEDEHSSMPPENYTHKPAADFSPPNKLNQLTGASQDHWDWHKNKVGPHSQNSGKQDSSLLLLAVSSPAMHEVTSQEVQNINSFQSHLDCVQGFYYSQQADRQYIYKN